MNTTVRATCPKCRTALRIPTQWIGQTVRCRNCRATVRATPKNDTDTPRPVSNGTAEVAALDQTAPASAFDFAKTPQAEAPFPLPEPIAPPAPAAHGDHPLDGFGATPQPQPAPAPAPVPGYPYPAPPGYPPGAYAPPGYPYAPPPSYPYPVPPGYPQPPGAYAPP